MSMSTRAYGGGLIRLMLGAALAATGLCGLGCGVSHIAEYEPKVRKYTPPVSFDAASVEPQNGSLFNARYAGTYLFSDHRAMRLGDIVAEHVREQADAQRGATTDLTRENDTRLSIDAFFGLLAEAGEILGVGDMLSLGSATGFKGGGLTARSERLEATVPATVREVLPNGNLFIEGHRVVLVNSEEHHFYVSGVVRPVDIQQDNSVASSLIADAEIEFTGRGPMTDKQEQPWLSKGLDYVMPF